MIRAIAADVLLGLAAAVVVISSLGVLVMRDVYQKLHFVSPAALVSPVLVTLAVWLHLGNRETTVQAVLALLFMLMAGPFLTHATIRAARIRQTGDWRPRRAGHPPAATGEGKQGS
ncbi:MAG: monovalent cation/H(+) antiporter subunit G [Actinobacteria bacterium]|nr:monovalent cation/H(+) antiporter subunit G [Actinomycetota bacterium]